MSLQRFETQSIFLAREWSVPFARFALFVLYFWFGLLKVIGLSPASGVVERLFNEMLGDFISFGLFIFLFGLFECLIGVLFLIPRASRIALILFAIHIVTTTGPLVLLSGEVWTAWFVPTMEGQYIIKNLALVAAALAVAANIEPQRQSA
jgi:hypothetical protein